MKNLLKNIPLFHDLDQTDLERISDSVEIITLAKGKELFHEGDQGHHAYVIQEGELEIIKTSNDREILLALRSTGDVIGEMSLLESMPRTATVRARTDATLLAVQKEELDHLMESSKSAMQSLFHIILARLRENQIHLRQSEKMVQLGTLTAGIAHELNNPSAAVMRGSDQLVTAIQKLDAAYATVSRLGFNELLWKKLNVLSENVQISAHTPPELDAIKRSDKEAEIENWLDDHHVDESWNIAPNLVNLDFNENDLFTLAEEFPAEKLQCVIAWLNAAYSVYSLLNELSQGSIQISSIVKSLKSYVFLGQAPVQSININIGLDDTLTILQSKLKGKINVKRAYSQDLQNITAYGSELNQVWTNLIDNAADALADQENAQIIIRTRQENKWVVVEIEDNGPGIPPEIQSRLFDAFFTTKEPGKGTGLGLNISYNIVVQKHNGDIKVYSHPGKTCFEVFLPLEHSL
ncbi:MAG: cyclic nucleotide-binding domain-containing protein [Anaerolineaceae bacterium]|nr:cyclic nucleotide-binding domain-containing protein [Anaerolineaceae bacterium]